MGYRSSRKKKSQPRQTGYPGDPVLVEPPHTQSTADDRLKEGYDCKTWYLCYKKP